jgi:hypothetical protein
VQKSPCDWCSLQTLIRYLGTMKLNLSLYIIVFSTPRPQSLPAAFGINNFYFSFLGLGAILTGEHGDLQRSPAAIPAIWDRSRHGIRRRHRGMDSHSTPIPQRLHFRRRRRRHALYPLRCLARRPSQAGTTPQAAPPRQPKAPRSTAKRQRRQPPSPALGERYVNTTS